MAGNPMESSLRGSPSGRDRADNEELTPEAAAAKPPDPDQARQSVAAKEPEYAIHLWMEGLSGECAAAHHKEWIVAFAYRAVAAWSGTVANETLQPTFEIEKNLDRASPALYHAVHIGRVFGKVIIEVCRDTERSERFLRIEMSDALITEVRQTAAASSGSSRPIEAVVSSTSEFSGHTRSSAKRMLSGKAIPAVHGRVLRECQSQNRGPAQTTDPLVLDGKKPVTTKPVTTKPVTDGT